VPRAIHHRDPVEQNLRHVLEIVPGTRFDLRPRRSSRQQCSSYGCA
jgi:hypothetical protein